MAIQVHSDVHANQNQTLKEVYLIANKFSDFCTLELVVATDVLCHRTNVFLELEELQRLEGAVAAFNAVMAPGELEA